MMQAGVAQGGWSDYSLERGYKPYLYGQRDRPAVEGSTPRPAVRKPSLLVVEDNSGTRKLLEYMLRARFEVVTASTVDEALSLVDRVAFDALLLDINLGEQRTGVDLLRIVREHPRYRNVPAVACTAYALSGDRERLLDAGFGAYVGKPFTKDDLFDALERVMSSEVPDDAPSTFDA